MSSAADRSYPHPPKNSPASYIGRKDRFMKSFTSYMGGLSTRYLQLGNLPIIKNGEFSYNSPSFIYWFWIEIRYFKGRLRKLTFRKEVLTWLNTVRNIKSWLSQINLDPLNCAFTSKGVSQGQRGHIPLSLSVQTPSRFSPFGSSKTLDDHQLTATPDPWEGD